MNNQRDPIKEWTDAISSRIGAMTMTLFLFAFVCALVAPIFAPAIRRSLLMDYVMEENYVELADRDMVGIRRFLWVIAILAWVLLIASNLHGYCN